jgi:hypothetical protein
LGALKNVVEFAYEHGYHEHGYDLVEDVATALRAAHAENERLRAYAKDVETERLTMARLAADTPQFDNPLVAWAVTQRRDEILRGAHLTTADHV